MVKRGKVKLVTKAQIKNATTTNKKLIEKQDKFQKRQNQVKRSKVADEKMDAG